MSASRLPAPRLPVVGWNTFSGPLEAAVPTLLAHPRHVLTTSGRAAILLALECLAVGPDDVVLLPTYHCPTMVSPVKTLGADAVFYPIDERGAPRLDWLSAHAPAHTKALLVPHYFGLPQPMDEARAWCDARGIALIEDCAHAMFGRAGARAIGSWGDVSIASLTKFFPTPEGGILALNRAGLTLPALTPASAIEQVKAASDILHMGASHDRLTGLNGLIRGAFTLKSALRSLLRGGAPGPGAAPSRHGELDEAEEIDANMALIDLPLSHRALTRASGWISTRVPRRRIVEARRRNYAFFTEAFADRPGVHALLPALPADCAPYVFPLWVRSPDPGYLEMRKLGVPVSRWDRLWPGVPALPGDAGKAWSHHVLQLACHQDLTDADLRRIVEQVERLYIAPAR
ncbi:DegT/DnrJ/EryC1/StrS family aminotransferase [Mitsuaria sp. GD03876]|uniref:DegT/DnrJ/EryC1/StrS family aminotransferase n=1 Tax=Mitsuaria sp. GD03876 TaxID=2975399 RepID=UPI002446D429|nr:DegT/DnrJ/EryC1/StrS family aminotransferase [Mitsuaria sp. GD03876]MDH0867769.1 DegT/DnrJ/EryC1/StrS family aminotransferase [Mitsuaria sp. GD03876]